MDRVWRNLLLCNFALLLEEPWVEEFELLQNCSNEDNTILRSVIFKYNNEKLERP